MVISIHSKLNMLKNLFKNTSKNLTKLSLALRALIGTLAGAAYVQADVRLAFWFLVAGAILDFIIQLLPPETEIKPGAKVLVVVTLLSLFWFSGCRSVRPETSSTVVKDTTIVTYKTVEVPIRGAAVVNHVNVDSLVNAIAKKKTEGQPLATAPVKVEDKDGKVVLEYWIDELGKLQINCQSKDQTIQVLVAEIAKLRKETKTIVQEVEKTPFWNYAIILLLGVALVLIVIKR